MDKSLLKNAENGPIWRVFENLKLVVKQSYQTGQFLNRSKIGGKCDILGDFQTLCAGGFITSPSSSFAAGKHCLLLTRSRKEVPSISMASFSWVLGYYPLAFPVLQHPLLSSRNAWRHQAP